MNYVKRLHEICNTFLSASRRNVVNAVLDDSRFSQAPGGAKHHHNYAGGLSKHTLEVAHLAMQFAEGFEGGLDGPPETSALIAAIFHDYGKIHEYKFNDDGTIGTTEFKDFTGHVTFSAGYFLTQADGRLNPDEINAIYHAILAHHGRKEWGSPVEPATPLAWALHSADMLSSRGYCEKQSTKDAIALVHLEGWKCDGKLAG